MADLEDVTLDGKPLQSLRVADLKAALEERGLSKSGHKNALVKRLKGALMLENLQKTSTAQVGLQPNSQIGEEMSQNSFIKQYLAKQQELLRQRLEREAREASETNEQEDHIEVNNSTLSPAQAQDATQASDLQKSPRPSDGDSPFAAVNEGGANSNQEAHMSPSPASGSVPGGDHQPDKRAAASDFLADSDDDDSEDGDDDGDDEDWDSNIRRRTPRQPARGPSTRERCGASCQPQQQHIPSLLSPQLRQPTPPPSPPPELSFPLPDTPKQSPPSPDVAPARRSPSSSSSGSSSSDSRSSSPEPHRGGHVERKPGPLTLLARKMESEGAFSGASWHGGNGEGGRKDSISPLATSFSGTEHTGGLTSANTHTDSMPGSTEPGILNQSIGGAHSAQSPVSGLKASAVKERDSELEALELERARLRTQEEEQAKEEERKRALEKEEEEKALLLEKKLALEKERQEREEALAKEQEEARERALELERQRALERERLQQKEKEKKEREMEKARVKALERERVEREKALEKERLEREKALEAERKEKERLEKEKLLEQERLERERLEKERIEKEKALERERLEREEALERERLEREKALELERLEQERLEKEKALEQERLEKEKALEQERLEKEREKALEQERLEKERAKALEQERLEKERAKALEQERLEKERAKALEQERLEKERAKALEQERLEKEREKALEQERLEREKALEQERLEKERQKALEQERLEKEREKALEQERLEKERVKALEQERLEREKALEQERLEKERLEKEREKALEQERLEREKALEQERLEKEREKALEQERLEKERAKALEQERLEKEREKALEQERLEREKALEQERLEKEREKALEQERLEKEREKALEQERLEREKALELERLEKEKALELERLEKEKALEKERLEREKALEQKRLEKERAKALEQERLEKEREKALEQERLEREKALQQKRLEKEREKALEKERLEKEKALELERLERGRALEQERLERERTLEQERLERERVLKQEQLEKEKALELERLERERALEQKRLERERTEQERLERERVLKQEQLEKEEALAREKALEQERLEKEKALECQRLEREKSLEQERLEQERKERVRIQTLASDKAEEQRRLAFEAGGNKNSGLDSSLDNVRTEEAITVGRVCEEDSLKKKITKELDTEVPPSKCGRELGLTPPTAPLSTGPGQKTEAGDQEDANAPMSPTSLSSSKSSFRKFRFSRDSPMRPPSSTPSVVLKRPRTFSDTPPVSSSPGQQKEGHQTSAVPNVGAKPLRPVGSQSEEVPDVNKNSSKESFSSQVSKDIAKDASVMQEESATEKAKDAGKRDKGPSKPADATQWQERDGKRENKKNRKRSSSDSSSSDSDSGSSSSRSSSSSSSSPEKSSISRSRRGKKPEGSVTAVPQDDSIKEISKPSPYKTSTADNGASQAKKPFLESTPREERKRNASEGLEEKDEQRKGIDSAMADSEKVPETSEETPKAFTARKISIGNSKTSPGRGSTDTDPESGTGRKRRWGSSTVVTVKKPSISITTDSLKSLIPDIKPCTGLDAVVDLYPEEVVLSGAEEEDPERSEQDLQIRRTVTQDISLSKPKVVPSDSQENGQREAKRSRCEEVEVNDVQGDATHEDKTSVPEIMGNQSPPQPSQDVELSAVTTGETLIRRSISQQKTGVSITIDDPVRTNRQPSPPRGKVSNIVHVNNLVRPFTLGQLKELLGRTGTLLEQGFWIDKIKSHCYVTYSSSEEAVATREALHGVKWPQSNPKVLNVDFCQQDELDFHKALGTADKPAAEEQWLGSTRCLATGLPSLLPGRDQWAEREREMERREKARAQREWDRDKVREFGKGDDKEAGPRRSRSREKRRKERAKSKEKKTEKKEKAAEEPPAKLLDDLFRKTKAAPCIYWLPLTDQQSVAREAARAERMKEREKRMKQQQEEKEKKREEERKERIKGGGGVAAGERSEGEKDKERERDRGKERERENDKRRDGCRRPGASGESAGRRSRSRSDPRDRRR
ncbi:apoptotic chromatin condensation inducer in the nucleus isoform X4 [Entelurus aequoreus]|uniref:apoptotic chromatin condensation inducer in the nucleus isoform X4 n=1 Tax=Entelurus aequoreus TaxID=161455 RepID=UPI002B1D7665|nr:apoptotic chromatin condensation inducer in the nucleus isoform X4 [Entelurus aequoreus]